MTPVYFATIALLAVPLGLIPAYIAKGKGHPDFVGWWVLGAFAFVIALPTALLMGPFRPDPPRPERPAPPDKDPIEASGAQVTAVVAVAVLAVGGTLVALL